MAAMTPAELIVLIQGLIIDNTTQQVNPAKLRAVLEAIANSLPTASDASTLTATSPLVLDPFTGILSMPESSESDSGYLSDLFFKKFNTGVGPIPASEFRIIMRGYQEGTANTDDIPKRNDIYMSFRSDNDDDIEGGGAMGLFQYTGEDGGDDTDPENFAPVLISIVNIT